jgi:hypothetical protein
MKDKNDPDIMCNLCAVSSAVVFCVSLDCPTRVAYVCLNCMNKVPKSLGLESPKKEENYPTRPGYYEASRGGEKEVVRVIETSNDPDNILRVQILGHSILYYLADFHDWSTELEIRVIN